MKDGFEERCRAKEWRWTRPRRLIVQVLAESRDHPGVEDLHRRVVKQNPRISRATIYRTLRILQSEGMIERHHFGESRCRYEQASMHHDRLIDLETRKVIELHSPEIERLQKEVAERLGYRLVGHRLELYARPMAENDSTERKRSE